MRILCQVSLLLLLTAVASSSSSSSSSLSSSSSSSLSLSLSSSYSRCSLSIFIRSIKHRINVSLRRRYELSQDLLDKQIEMLERKYGGVKARNAALTIQRAFRRYTLLKKFAAITAMAKAEKRLSRKLQESTTVDRPIINANDHERMVTYHSQIYIQQSQTTNNNRPMPIRSMSLRERRHVDNNSQSPIPRSQSGRCEIQMGGGSGGGIGGGIGGIGGGGGGGGGHHQHVNHGLHQSGRHTPSLAPSPCNRHQPLPPSPCWESSSQESGSSIHYYNPQVT